MRVSSKTRNEVVPEMHATAGVIHGLRIAAAVNTSATGRSKGRLRDGERVLKAGILKPSFLLRGPARRFSGNQSASGKLVASCARRWMEQGTELGILIGERVPIALPMGSPASLNVTKGGMGESLLGSVVAEVEGGEETTPEMSSRVVSRKSHRFASLKTVDCALAVHEHLEAWLSEHTQRAAGKVFTVSRDLAWTLIEGDCTVGRGDEVPEAVNLDD